MKKAKKKNHRVLRTIGWTTLLILKTITIDLIANIKKAYNYGKNPEIRDQIKLEISNKRLINEKESRIRRLERLVYCIFKDPKYVDRFGGREDIRELKKELKGEEIIWRR